MPQYLNYFQVCIAELQSRLNKAGGEEWMRLASFKLT